MYRPDIEKDDYVYRIIMQGNLEKGNQTRIVSLVRIEFIEIWISLIAFIKEKKTINTSLQI